jgi:hypothetical protein
MPIFDPNRLKPGLRPRPAPPPTLPDIYPITPPFNPSAPAGIPGGVAPPPAPYKRPQGRYDEVTEARDTYLKGATRRRSGLLGALQGGLQGLATGGLGGALGGLVGGGLAGAVNPRGQREQEFNAKVLPKIGERWMYEDMDRANAAANAKAQQEGAYNQARMANIYSEISSRKTRDEIERERLEQSGARPIIVSPGQTAYDPKNRRPIFSLPAAPKGPTSAELGVDPESGMSFEEMAEASYQGRGGDQYVFSKLPQRTQRLINGEIDNPDPAEVAEANRTYQAAIKQQRDTDLRYTRGHIRAKRIGATKSLAPIQSPTQQQSAPQAPQPRPGEAEALAEVERLEREAKEAGEAYKRFQARTQSHGSLAAYSVPLAGAVKGFDDLADWYYGTKVMDKRAADEAADKYYRALSAFKRNYPAQAPPAENSTAKPRKAGKRNAISVSEAASLLR